MFGIIQWLMALALAAGLAGPAFADEWIADASTGCRVWNYKPPQSQAPGDSISWSGVCERGLAQGKGVLQWALNGRPGARYEGEMKDGRREGAGIVFGESGFRYEGQFRRGLYDGVGTRTLGNGSRYEGGWQAGQFHGNGVLSLDRSNPAAIVGYEVRQAGAWAGDAYVVRGVFDAGELMQICDGDGHCRPLERLLKASLLKGGDTLQHNPGCSFFYPFDDAWLAQGTAKSDKADGGFWWSGECRDGLLEGRGNLGVVEYTRNPKGFVKGWVTPDFEQYLRFTIPDVSFVRGRQAGRLSMPDAGLRNYKSGDDSVRLVGEAENFHFTGLFAIQGRLCTSWGWAVCQESVRYDEKVLWMDMARPQPFTAWLGAKDTGRLSNQLLACQGGQTVEQCRWSAMHRERILGQIAEQASAGACKALAASLQEAIRQGGLDVPEADRRAECAANAKFAAVLAGKAARPMYFEAVTYEDQQERGRAKTVYRELMKRFPSSNEAMQAANRLARLGDVEAVEAAEASSARAAESAGRASREAAESVRAQSYQQCMNNSSACHAGCRNSSARSSCEAACPICSR